METSIFRTVKINFTVLFDIETRHKRRKRKEWAHPFTAKNVDCKWFVATKGNQRTDKKFRSMYRITKSTYLELVTRKSCNCKAICKYTRMYKL